jgi:hypothetical protein
MSFIYLFIYFLVSDLLNKAVSCCSIGGETYFKFDKSGNATVCLKCQPTHPVSLFGAPFKGRLFEGRKFSKEVYTSSVSLFPAEGLTAMRGTLPL